MRNENELLPQKELVIAELKRLMTEIKYRNENIGKEKNYLGVMKAKLEPIKNQVWGQLQALLWVENDFLIWNEQEINIEIQKILNEAA